MATPPQASEGAGPGPTAAGPGGGSEAPAPACVVVRGRRDASYPGMQALAHFAGASARSAGTQRSCLHLLTIPPGGQARPHLHEHHETAVYVVCGTVEYCYGEGLRQRLVLRAGDLLSLPAGAPRAPVDLSQTEPCAAVIARAAPNEQESVVLRPDLDGAV